MNDSTKTIIQNNADLIEQEDFDTLIRKVPAFERPDLVNALLSAGIDFLATMPKIYPHMFAYLPITSISIPANIKEIGPYAFLHCEKLQEIHLSEGITQIAHDCFRECSTLESIKFPTTLTYIGEAAFKKCDMLTDVTIPGNIKVIESFAFLSCARLRKVYVQDGIEEIRESAFNQCSSLSKVRLPASLKKIEAGAFFFSDPKLHVDYAGTAEQWNNIDIEAAAFKGNITIKCSDKRIKLEE